MNATTKTYTVHIQDFVSNWEKHQLSTPEEVSDLIHSTDAAQAIEIEGAEFAGNIPTSEELEAWVKAQETSTPTYINTDERYGDAVAVTIDDYRELNPTGEFSQDADGIYEDGHGQIAEAS